MLHRPKQYTSNLRSEKQWQLILQLLPERSVTSHPLKLDMREVIRAIYYLVVTGCQWSNLPSDFPNYKSVYYHYRKWCLDSTWRRINQQLVYLECLREGRLPRPSAGIIDSQSAGQRRAVGSVATMATKKSVDASVTFWWIRRTIYWKSW